MEKDKYEFDMSKFMYDEQTMTQNYCNDKRNEELEEIKINEKNSDLEI